MSNNQYFLVQKNSDQTFSIVSGPNSLPDIFGNTSGFNHLETNAPELLPDLTWQGNPDQGFWLVKFDDKPNYSVNQKLTTNYTLDATTKTGRVSYTIENLPSDEYDSRKENLRQQIRIIRDRYLSLTDFTQISDVPFSAQIKAEFATFRQQLRDLPNVNDPSSITWPTIPTSVNINLPPFPQIPTYK